MIRIGMLITSAVLLSACSTSNNDDSNSADNHSENYGYHYQCSDDKTFQADYLIEDRGALVNVDGEDYALVQVPAGSGTRYMLPEFAQTEVAPINLYTKGDYARLEYGLDVFINCINQ